MANALIDIPKTVRRGEPFTVKVVLDHIMETGYRRDISGKPIPRNIVRWFAASLGGEEIIRIDLTQAVAANPYFGFRAVANVSAPLVMVWEDDAGAKYREEIAITVTG
jgi:sulfur-oxidizing protein SoxZ